MTEEYAHELERIADEIEEEDPEHAELLRADAMLIRGNLNDIIEDPIEERKAALAKRLGIPVEEVTDEVLERWRS